jgi:hypothetical protein
MVLIQWYNTPVVPLIREKETLKYLYLMESVGRHPVTILLILIWGP